MDKSVVDEKVVACYMCFWWDMHSREWCDDWRLEGWFLLICMGGVGKLHSLQTWKSLELKGVCTWLLIDDYLIIGGGLEIDENSIIILHG